MAAPTQDTGKIYFLPNLMTAGNLVCGFLAVLKIIEGTLQREAGSEAWIHTVETSLYFILGACIFDLLDGRLARLGGRESSFGREFDSLADLVSFGVAPALLVFKIVLAELPNRVGWVVAVFYLLCGALRLARFNVAATLRPAESSREFTGFPIPAAAGLISSITLLMLSFYQNQRELEAGYGKYALMALMIFLSFMMFSTFKYPSFKVVSWRTKHSLPKFLGVVLMLFFIVLYYQWMFAVMFVTYLLYGFFRPFISLAMRRFIEEDEDDDPDEENPAREGMAHPVAR
jgi:CDP-diacylglycerol--serine O-phosphatidyltransferase